MVPFPDVPSPGPEAPDGAWKQCDVAAFLQVDAKTVQRLDVPRVPIELTPGKRPLVRYDPREVRAWWAEQVERARRERAARPALRVAGRRPAGAVRFDRTG